MMTDLIAEITKALLSIKGNQFVSLEYLTKKSHELARYTILVGFNYHRAVEKSVVDLEVLITENTATWTPLQKLAADQVMESLKETLTAHAEGRQNEAYTKKNQYISIGNGVNINSTDRTIQLFGLVQSKVTLIEGEYPKVNSTPLTIEKNKIRKQLTLSRFREFAIDQENIGCIKVNGDTIELVPTT